MVDHEENRGSYFIDPNSAQEMARLLLQERELTKGMGGILPERGNDFSGFQVVLDIGCGPGGWILDLARDNPRIQTWGVDISQQMIAYAQALAQSQQITNAHFLEMDVSLLDEEGEEGPKRISAGLDFFPDRSFDLMNVRYLIGFLRAEHWPALFQKCKQKLRPGGIFRITESELAGVSTSPALERMIAWLIQSLWKAGQSFSPDGRRVATIAAISPIFRQTGYDYNPQNHMSHLIDYSFGTEGHQSFYENWKMGYKLAQPFLVKMGVATQEEIDETYRQMLAEMQQENFCGVYDLHTFWARKPL